MLLHRLQQRRLRLRRGAIDLISQQHLREDRAALELEIPAATSVLHHHVGPDDVGRHQVRRELDPRKSQVERLRQRLDQQRLPQTWDALEQHVPPGQQRDQHVIDQLLVTNDHAAHFPADPIERLGELFWCHGPLFA